MAGFTEEEILRMRQESRAEGMETAGYIRLFEEIMGQPPKVSPDDSQSGQPS